MFQKYDLDLDPFDEEVYDEFLETHARLKQTLSSLPVVEWTTHEKDLKTFSKKHPKIIFSLFCDGGYVENVWLKYFKNGKLQLAPANIEFEPFNAKKLK